MIPAIIRSYFSQLPYVGDRSQGENDGPLAQVHILAASMRQLGISNPAAVQFCEWAEKVVADWNTMVGTLGMPEAALAKVPVPMLQPEEPAGDTPEGDTPKDGNDGTAGTDD